MTRPSWDEYFLGLAEAVSQRADCRRRRVGCVLVNAENRIIATGYNAGADCLAGKCPRGLLTYEQQPGLTQSYSNCAAIHAEDSALRAMFGELDTAYVNHKPCPGCLHLLIEADARRIVWLGDEVVLR